MSNEVPRSPFNNLDELYAAEAAGQSMDWMLDEPYEGSDQEGLEIVPPYTGSFYDATEHMPPPDPRLTLREPDLLKSAQDGDRDAASLFIDNKLSSLPHILARGEHSDRYNAIGHAIEAHDDLVQIAVLGLYKAIKNYDRSKGSFAQYVELCVFGDVRRATTGGLYISSIVPQAYGSLVRVPNDPTGFHKVDSYTHRQEVKEWGELDAKALQAETDFTDQEIAHYFENLYVMTPLQEAPEVEDIIDERHETMSREIEAAHSWNIIRPWLDDRTATLLYMHEVLDLSYRQIGSRLGISGGRVGQIYAAAQKDIPANPAIAHAFDLPTICNPNFPYEEKWKSSDPCPIDTFPSPEKIRKQNGINYEKAKGRISRRQISWLSKGLQRKIERLDRRGDY